MTVDREKLREELAALLWELSHYQVGYGLSWEAALAYAVEHPTHAASYSVDLIRKNADALIVGPLALILTQADSAERVAAVHAEDLIAPLARDLAREGGWQDPDAPWTENQAIIARGGAGAPVYQEYLDDARSLLGREALRSILSQNVRLSAEVERLRAALKQERTRRAIAVQSVRAQAATLCDEVAAYFDRTTGHYDRAQAASSYRATASKVRLLRPRALSTTGTDAPAAAQEGSDA